MDIVSVTEDNIELFSKVLIESARWLESIGESMWKVQDLTAEELLKKYEISEMKLCYEDGNLVGVYILQWYDPIFGPKLKKNDSGILHKLALCRENSKMGYGKKLIESAELLCKKMG